MICHQCGKIMDTAPCDYEKLYVEEEFVCRACIEQRKAWVSAEYGRQLRKREMAKQAKQAAQPEQLQINFTPVSTRMTQTLICPYCGEDHGAELKGHREIIECKACGKRFIYWLLKGTYDSALPMSIVCPYCRQRRHYIVDLDETEIRCSNCFEHFEAQPHIKEALNADRRGI